MRQLVLERFGGGGHNYAGAQGQRRHQIGQALARACARLYNEVALRPDGRAYRLGHLPLLRPVLVRRQRARGPGQSAVDQWVCHERLPLSPTFTEDGPGPGRRGTTEIPACLRPPVGARCQRDENDDRTRYPGQALPNGRAQALAHDRHDLLAEGQDAQGVDDLGERLVAGEALEP